MSEKPTLPRYETATSVDKLHYTKALGAVGVGEAVISDTSETDTGGRLSFADLEHRSKPLLDDSIMSIMTERMEIASGERAFNTKHWLDQVRADDSDVEFTHNPEKVIDFRNQLSDLVNSKLKLRKGSDYPDDGNERRSDYIKSRIQKFRNKIEEDKDLVASLVRVRDDSKKRRKVLNDQGLRYGDVTEFHGMYIKVGGEDKDLLAGDASNFLRSNIYMQREIAGLFVHYSSDAYEQARMHDEKPELNKRIYLNPKFEDSVAIFDEIISAADEAGIVMKGKIFDRLNDGMWKDKISKGKGEFANRGDGIVLLVGEDADELLELVSTVYKDHVESFKGRGMSKIPMKIADGLAVGDEPQKGSLTSNRAEMLDACKEMTRAQLAGDYSDRARVLATFRRNYRDIAIREGVNPDNIAFNKK